ncbi:MAG: AraC family transcriptional regulator [Chloroflexota bacterium]|nr:AraC family transcriptional regulator [Chloroflexota bacterium]
MKDSFRQNVDHISKERPRVSEHTIPLVSAGTILDPNGQVIYKEYLPSQRLRSFVARYSVAISQAPIESLFLHRVIPDGCVHIIFNFNHSLDRHGFVIVPVTKAQFIPFSGYILTIGIRFLPGSAPYFLHNHIRSLGNQPVSLEDVLGPADSRILSEELQQVDSVEKRMEILDEYVFQRIAGGNRDMDDSLNHALYLIHANKGNIRVSDLAKRLQISHRQLGRQFDMWIGTSPKTLCRIVRFQNYLKTLESTSQPDTLSAALDSGYYDQSHLIHEFKVLYGTLPSLVTSTGHLS